MTDWEEKTNTTMTEWERKISTVMTDWETAMTDWGKKTNIAITVWMNGNDSTGRIRMTILKEIYNS